MAEYDKALALALRLITKKGRACSIRQAADPTVADADKPWRATKAAPTDIPAVCVLLPWGTMGDKYLPGTEVQVGDQLAFIPASGLTAGPELRDTLVFGSEKPWAVVARDVLAPDGVPILYTMQVRR